MRNAFFPAVCLLLAATAANGQTVDREFPDTVLFLDDAGALQESKNVRVDSATFREVKFTLRGGRTSLTRDGRRVALITYGDAPRLYLSALQAMAKQHYRKAADDFDAARNAVVVGDAREWVNEYAAVNKARALLALGRSKPSALSEAIDEYGKALEANPQSLLFPDIQVGLAECHRLRGNHVEAKSAADALMTAAEEIKQPVWKARAQKALAQILLAQDNFSEARAAYGELVRLAKDELQYKSWEIGEKNERLLREIQVEGAVEQGWVLVSWAESGSAATWTSARTYFQELGRDGAYVGNDFVEAAVLNGLGRCLLDEDPRKALEMFIQAEVSHFAARGEVARALHLKAQALEKLGGTRNKELARMALAELREFYPGSKWAGK